MTEPRARLLATVIVGAEVLLAFLLIGLVLVGMSWSSLFMPEVGVPAPLVCFLVVFLLLGSFIIVSARSPIGFHLLTVAVLVLLVWLGAGIFDLTVALVLAVFLLAPAVFYYVNRLRLATSQK